MRELVLSLLAGWIIGIVLSWLKIPLPAPPLAGLLGLAGMTLGGWCFALLGKSIAALNH
ncbi:MAG: DUF1427 family protein [Chroococcidiopsidaceae cyanobacterium CP_BM_ER_R8_30]|nr:DUF1427 family protein [Chroococcidiopsidaceae cyanobacterium CP_BM_ER_R8_30]